MLIIRLTCVTYLLNNEKKGRFVIVFCFNATKKKDENKPSWLVVVYN